jgi:5-formyltetrahydrofolate cyclo-ligase
MMNKLNKQAIRKRLLNERKLLSQQSILGKSKIIADTLINFDKYQQSENIMLYVATKKEVQTQEVIESAQKDNKKIFIPLINRGKSDLIPALIYDFKKELVLGSLGIYQPREEFYRLYSPKILDLVIVPGVAFTGQGNRLGRGGGYYDRFLTKVRENTYSVALAFEMQIVDQIPKDENDIPVDFIITEKRIIRRK